MPKLAIYVSKQDMRELEKWRRKINFSQVFMKALTREIRERSRALEAPEEKLDAAARHYKARLAEDADALIDFGFRLGSGHVLECRLSPAAIRRIVSISRPEEMNDEDLAAVREAIGDAEKSIDEFAAKQGVDESVHPTWRTAVYSGYARGVARAWQQVCERMRSDSAGRLR